MKLRTRNKLMHRFVRELNTLYMRAYRIIGQEFANIEVMICPQDTTTSDYTSTDYKKMIQFTCDGAVTHL